MRKSNGSNFVVPAGVFWTVLGPGKNSNFLLCRCVCGKEKNVNKWSLKRGGSKSCDCMKATLVGNARRVHGRSRTSIHNIWSTMLDRCNPNVKAFREDYAGRGIKVCERWKGPDGFINFLADMGERPSSKHSIERRDNDGDYCPENCYWGTVKEQTRNRRSNVNITYNGVTKCLSDWAAEKGFHPVAFKYRIEKWGLERAMTEPKNTTKKGRPKRTKPELPSEG